MNPPANNSGPTDRVLDEGFDVEALAQSMGITEYNLRKMCRDHAKEISLAMREAADEVLFSLAHHEGLIPLAEPVTLDELVGDQCLSPYKIHLVDLEQ